MHVFLCVPACLSIFLVYLSLPLFFCLSIFICLSLPRSLALPLSVFCLSNLSSVCLSFSQSVSLCLSVILSLFLFVCLTLILFLRLSACLSYLCPRVRVLVCIGLPLWACPCVGRSGFVCVGACQCVGLACVWGILVRMCVFVLAPVPVCFCTRICACVYMYSHLCRCLFVRAPVPVCTLSAYMDMRLILFRHLHAYVRICICVRARPCVCQLETVLK